MKRGLVTFIVPCYKLAHLLPECIQSILNQTYREFEILIMDDCSPDDTPTVAGSFSDQRIRYIRNERNLGHLRNYNKGIDLSSGKYIWLISADDKLRRTDTLERYVRVMQSDQNIGYVFCSCVGVQDGIETGIIDSYYYGPSDHVFEGHDFIATVLRKDGGLGSPSVMVRKECYERIAMFPLDMPHQGDLYLWFIWALQYDVAYIAEPLVNYRLHDCNMMKDLMNRVPQLVFQDVVNVLWRTKQRINKKKHSALVLRLEDVLARKYTNAAMLSPRQIEGSGWPITVNDCVEAIRSHASSSHESQRLLALFYAHLGDKQWSLELFECARKSYVKALSRRWWMLKVWMKLFLALTGQPGVEFRRTIKGLAASPDAPISQQSACGFFRNPLTEKWK
jgi:glycosyltransferase involved in cell wall biosynthesis